MYRYSLYLIHYRSRQQHRKLLSESRRIARHQLQSIATRSHCHYDSAQNYAVRDDWRARAAVTCCERLFIQCIGLGYRPSLKWNSKRATDLTYSRNCRLHKWSHQPCMSCRLFFSIQQCQNTILEFRETCSQRQYELLSSTSASVAHLTISHCGMYLHTLARLRDVQRRHIVALIGL